MNFGLGLHHYFDHNYSLQPQPLLKRTELCSPLCCFASDQKRGLRHCFCFAILNHSCISCDRNADVKTFAKNTRRMFSVFGWLFPANRHNGISLYVDRNKTQLMLPFYYFSHLLPIAKCCGTQYTQQATTYAVATMLFVVAVLQHLMYIIGIIITDLV